jgi:hypothetical protein
MKVGRYETHCPLGCTMGDTAVLAAVLSFVVPVFVDRHEYARAVVDYVKNPNSENNAIRRLERTKNQRIALRTPIVAAGVLFVLMNAGCFLVGQSSARLSKTV